MARSRFIHAFLTDPRSLYEACAEGLRAPRWVEYVSWREESSFQGLCINYHHGERPGEEANAAWLNVPGPGCYSEEVTVDTCPLKDDLEQTRKTSNVKVSLRWEENHEKEREQSSLGKDIVKKASFWEVMPSADQCHQSKAREVSD